MLLTHITVCVCCGNTCSRQQTAWNQPYKTKMHRVGSNTGVGRSVCLQWFLQCCGLLSGSVGVSNASSLVKPCLRNSVTCPFFLPHVVFSVLVNKHREKALCGEYTDQIKIRQHPCRYRDKDSDCYKRQVLIVQKTTTSTDGRQHR